MAGALGPASPSAGARHDTLAGGHAERPRGRGARDRDPGLGGWFRRRPGVAAALGVGILMSTAPRALAQTCESHFPESASFPLAVTRRALIEQTITDRNGVATTAVGPISAKTFFDSPQSRVASVAPSSLALFRACDGKFPAAMGSHVEQNGAFQVRTTFQASD